MMRSHGLTITLAFCALWTPTARADVDFNRDVRPILSARCFKCHGPDDTTRESGLRLDTREGAIAEADSGEHAIVPGKPDASELLRRITSDDDSERMPPPEANQDMTDTEIRILREWIVAGAEYEPHWAYVAPQRPDLPAVQATDWPRNGIDHFILAKLESEGLEPSPEADRYTLVRRVYLDLTGLPPTPAEADAFVHDTATDAYERLVDRLLASPRYGERWARPWLDLARYADTNGYEKDRPRSVWPYRDWVINALNADMPFDQFTIEQIAGDMLPHPTRDQLVATGFHRNTMLNEEGGIDPLEFRYYAMVDRVGTTATTWLGLTLACAQCHTHKYDPIPHEEYYRFMAFLNNADEIKLEVPTEEQQQRREELEQQIADLEANLPDRFPLPENADAAADPDTFRRQHLEESFAKWLAREQQKAIHWTVLEPTHMESNIARLETLPDGSILASGDTTKRDVYELTFTAPPAGVTAFRLEALPHDSLPAHGPGRTYYEGREGDFFLSEFVLTLDGQPQTFNAATETHAKLAIGGGDANAALCIDGEPHTGWSASGNEGHASQAVFNLDKPLSAGETLSLTMIFERHYAAALGRFRISWTADTHNVVAKKRPAAIEELLARPADQLSKEDRDRLLRHYLSVAPELEEARKQIDALRKQIPEPATTLIFTERPADHPRPTHVHHRGEFLQPKEQVDAAPLSILHDLPPDAPRNRLTFARWLVDPANPLVGRVTVNRHWAALFGTGLVRTTEDFGYQGESPSHPELLDWLALEFIRRNWSMKQLHRLIVTSATYRQSSRVTPELLEHDPNNRLLARGPRTRLEAELIRDAILQMSGLLSGKIGGPSVFPPQPASVTTEGAYGKLQWKVSEREDRYRRGLYTFAKRTTPYAMFTTFDAPSGEACVPRREVSNTPLQALTLLNDAVFMEAARHLGDEFAAAEGTDADRLTALFRRCLVRPPATEELQPLQAFLTSQREHFRQHPQQAATILGEESPAEGANRAAWLLTARAILNLDETITKD